ncbi:MAG: hypothetical protein EPN91_02115 [Salinibacterium sp.]|nr:MAG: hypothetical protein EPN91_02115 [Salinibacterium sp.]
MARLNDKTAGVTSISARATAAVTGNPTAPLQGGGLFVTLDTDRNFFVLSSAGGAIHGILEGNAAINSDQTIRMDGIALIKLGGTVADDAYVQSGASGVGVTWDGFSPVGGQALKGGSSGDYVSIIVGRRPPIGSNVAASFGTAVASASAIVPTGHVFHVTGTTSITSITSTGIAAGTMITIIFDGILTFTDGNNLKLAGNMSTTADDTITLVFDGTNFYEVARSAN